MSRIKNYGLMVLFLAISGLVPLRAQAKNNASEILEPAEALLMPATAHSGYAYIMEGRPDPFVPFLSKKVVAPKINPNEIIDEKVELTGMRQFEPGQLRLVAVLNSTKRVIAMVEDVTGRGYVLKKGMAIGRRGVVTEINRQQVLVTETAHTRAGKKIENTIVMRLQKEGEQ